MTKYYTKTEHYMTPITTTTTTTAIVYKVLLSIFT